MPYLTRDKIVFHYLDRGTGLPVFLQHGLGSETEKVFAQVELPRGFRLLGLDCRAHGKTLPVGDPEKLCFSSFADDLLGLMDHLKIERAVVGGTSMGAGVALNFALRYPHRLLALILLRPAWLDTPTPSNVSIFGSIAQLLKQHGPESGLELFRNADEYVSISKVSLDSAESLAALFTDPLAAETCERLQRIPRDAPSRDRAEWRRIALPTLVLANRQDPIHPFEFGEILAREIPGALFEELTPKSVNLAQYLAELNRNLAGFLRSLKSYA